MKNKINILTMIVTSFILATSYSMASSVEVIDAKANVTIASFEKKYNASKFLSNLAGYIVFPSVIKGGFIFGGEYGEGVLRIKGESKEYYSIASASVGFQAGIQKGSCIIAFSSKKTLENFRNSNGWEASVDGTLTVVKWGVGRDIISLSYEKPIYAFIFDSKGAMVGLSLEGSKFQQIQPSVTAIYDDIDKMTN